MGSLGRCLRLLGCLSIAAGLAVPSFAQSSTGSIQGVVTDAQGGIMPGVAVTIRNTDTNATRTLMTDSQGRYRLPNLQPGPYELTAELTGFAKLVRSGLTLALNQDAVVDVAMKTATMTETVTVVGDAALLNTTTPEVGVRF